MKHPIDSVDARLMPASDHAQLETDWRLLEATAGSSPFTSWEWVSTWLATLPATIRPLLFRAEDDQGLLALALLVIAKSRLARTFAGGGVHMQETGIAAFDDLTIEYGGLLARPGDESLAYAALLHRLSHSRLRHRELRIPASQHAAFVHAAFSPDWSAWRTQSSPVYFIDLTCLGEKNYLHCLSSSTRYDVRRTLRAYTAHGDIRLEFASSVGAALQWFAGLESLHQKHWQAKGRAGAFQHDYFRHFHRELIRTSFASGLPRLARLHAGDWMLGYYYHLIYRRNVYCYNGGLDYSAPTKHHRPGYLMHLKAIERAIADGCGIYDFLASEAFYKKTLSTWCTRVDWIALAPSTLRNRLRRTLAERLLRRPHDEELPTTSAQPFALR